MVCCNKMWKSGFDYTYILKCDGEFFLEVLFLEPPSGTQHFKCKSVIFVLTYPNTFSKSTEKDNFHNLIYGIDKRYHCDNWNVVTSKYEPKGQSKDLRHLL